MQRFFLVSVFAIAWFALLIPWNGFADPDAFYHAKAASLLLAHGPIKDFPWLDLTLLGSSYADLHFLFHLIVAPFVKLAGPLQGLRIATVVLAAIFIAVFDACLRWMNLRYATIWTLLLVTSHAFAFRLLLGKATPLALILFVLGLSTAWKRKPLLLFAITCAYALSHGGWVYLFGSVMLLALGDAFFHRLVLESPWRLIFRDAMWKEVIASFLGGITGLIVHPNFPETFRFAWAQVVTIGLGTPFQHVVLGTEWLPSDISSLLVSMSLWIIVFVIGIYGLIFSRSHCRLAHLPISLGLIVAVLVALTFKSRRNIEYLIPAIALWCASLWNFVDGKKLFTIFPFTRSWRGRLIALCIVVVFGKQIYTTWTDFHPPRYVDDVYRSAMDEISRRALPGDRIFHSSWDEFPMLFAADERLRYISGLDPTFLYIASSTLSDRVRDVTRPLRISTSTRDGAWSLIHNELQSRFVFVSKREKNDFLNLIRSDGRYEIVADTKDSAAFLVR